MDQPGKNATVEMAQSSNRTSNSEKDLEQSSSANSHFVNDIVSSISWDELNVTVEDRKSKTPKTILTSTSGYVEAGKVLALMGPSGCGKTTMLNVLAHRSYSKAQISGTIRINGQTTNAAKLSQVARYVEQEDALIGSLTVRETVKFAAQLALPNSINKKERLRRVDDAIQSFGIEAQANSLIGTPIRKGISGGQKRRVSVASQLVTSPKILFLDEPTSGLDSAASREVMSYISSLAKKLRLIVIISIHQPSTTTFNLLDHIMLLSAGKTCYFGPRQAVESYFSTVGHPIPQYMNPAEFLLDLINIDFAFDTATAQAQLDQLHQHWVESEDERSLRSHISSLERNTDGSSLQIESSSKPGVLSQTFTLLNRAFIKSYRDVVAYQLRIAMYLGLAIMMGTVWLRLPYTQISIQTFINAIFFGGAFMSFMAVAYIPAYIEDLHMFRKERANGLYGPLPFVLANFLIGIPYLFLITILFSVISYWLVNLRPSAGGFWLWVLYLFLDLLAAEGLVVLIASLMPIFVVALAVTAFANGLWMCVGGFLVPPGTLNVFWKYVFHYIDYQAWVTQALIINQFKTTVYDCASDGNKGWNCMYPSDLEGEGKIRGTAVIEAFRYGYGHGENGKIIGIMIGIIAVYRIFGYLALVLRK